jgi:hypothetical protein
MYTDEDLNSAVDAGIVPVQTALAFRNYVAEQAQSSSVDEEHFRLISGFNDVFVVIASVLLLSAVAFLGSLIISPGISGFIVAGFAWGLAEFFTRVRRMALPSIVLLFAFVGGVFFGTMALLGGNMHFGGASETELVIQLLVSGLAAGLAAMGHWQRFHVPITVAAGVAAVAIAVLAVVLQLIKTWFGVVSLTPLLFVVGVVVFLLAMKWDMSDIERQTGRSDVAFWLHLLAAPLLIHPVFTSLTASGGVVTGVQALAVLAVYLGVALISICVDRRALMVSALAYVLFTFAALLKQYDMVSFSFALVAFVIGMALLMLSAFWHTVRVSVFQRLPHSVQKWLPPVRA